MKTIRLDGLKVDAKVQKPGSRGGHITGYSKSGEPIYGKPKIKSEHHMFPHQKSQAEHRRPELLEKVKGWPSEARNQAEQAIYRLGHEGALVLEANRGGKTVGGLGGFIYDDSLHVENVGAYGSKGAGTDLLRKAAERALSRGIPLTLTSTAQSDSYYKNKLGLKMHKEGSGGQNVYKIPRDRLAQFIHQGHLREQ